MKTATTFYHWWQNTVHGNFIENPDFDLVLQKFQTKHMTTEPNGKIQI